MSKITSETLKDLENYKWDFKNPNEYQRVIDLLGKETFEKLFTNNIKGKIAISNKGLLFLTHLKKFKSIKTEILTDLSINEIDVVFKATLVGFQVDPLDDTKLIDIEIVRHGDATLKKVSSMMKEHYVRLAETRAVNRVFVDYLNVNYPTAEEFSNIENEIDYKKVKITNEMHMNLLQGAEKTNISEEKLLKLINLENTHLGLDKIEKIENCNQFVISLVLKKIQTKFNAIKRMKNIIKHKIPETEMKAVENLLKKFNKTKLKELTNKEIIKFEEMINELSEEIKISKSNKE